MEVDRSHAGGLQSRTRTTLTEARPTGLPGFVITTPSRQRGLVSPAERCAE
jgi:hypothetical protein